jgi:hypothetical protein
MLIVLCALAGAAVAGVLVARGGGGETTTAMPTTGQYAPIKPPKHAIPLVSGVLLGDPDPGGVGGDLELLLTPLKGAHRYQVSVTNTSSIGFIHAFEWFPPPGVSIVKVVGSSSGRCELAGNTGFGGNQFKNLLLYPRVLCEGLNLKPPTCICRADGGSESFSFVADRDMIGGTATARSMTPVLKVIPAYPQAPDK